MKKFFLPLIAFSIVIPNPVNSEIDPKIVKVCMKANDFQGCVKAMGGGVNTASESKVCKGLNQGLSIVRERLISGTSMMKLDVNTNPLSDALAIAKVESNKTEECQTRIKGAQEVLNMVRVFRDAWGIFNDAKDRSDIRNQDVWLRRLVEPSIKSFNAVSGGINVPVTGPGVSLKWKDTNLYGYDYEIRKFEGGGIFKICTEECGDYVVKSPIPRMISAINGKIISVLNDTPIVWEPGPDPNVQLEILKREEELQKEKEEKKKKMGPKNINCKSPVWKNKPQCR